MRFIVLVLLAMISTTTSAKADGDHQPIGKDIAKVPLFDAHMHYKQSAWPVFPPKTVIELMDRSGVAMALVSSTPDEGTIRLLEFAPKRIVPELRPYHGNANSSNWTKAPGMAEYLKTRLQKYPHQGIGEFHIHNIDKADEPLLRQVTEMARLRKIPIHIHSDIEAVELLYHLAPDITVIWAHAGMSAPADVVEKAMLKYPSLYADTSFREVDILTREETIEPAWRKVLERFPDRFMIGTDTWVNQQWQIYEKIIAMNRVWLSQFPRKIAEQIAYRNAEKLFKRKVTNGLIGKR